MDNCRWLTVPLKWRFLHITVTGAQCMCTVAVDTATGTVSFFLISRHRGVAQGDGLSAMPAAHGCGWRQRVCRDLRHIFTYMLPILSVLVMMRYIVACYYTQRSNTAVVDQRFHSTVYILVRLEHIDGSWKDTAWAPMRLFCIKHPPHFSRPWATWWSFACFFRRFTVLQWSRALYLYNNHEWYVLFISKHMTLKRIIKGIAWSAYDFPSWRKKGRKIVFLPQSKIPFSPEIYQPG